MNDKIYMKEDKAGTTQQLRSRRARLCDELRRLEKEKVDILADIVKIDNQLADK